MEQTANRHCRNCGGPIWGRARYCSGGCKQAAYRGRLTVTESPGATAPHPTVTTPSPGLLRWYDRLDGASDLYLDTETTSRQVARIFRLPGQRLDRPSLAEARRFAESLGSERSRHFQGCTL